MKMRRRWNETETTPRKWPFLTLSPSRPLCSIFMSCRNMNIWLTVPVCLFVCVCPPARVRACLCLTQASGKNLNLNDESQHGLLMQLLKLSYNCLNYDFIGTSTDESSDDLCTVQIPTSWRSGELHRRHAHLLLSALQRIDHNVRC